MSATSRIGRFIDKRPVETFLIAAAAVLAAVLVGGVVGAEQFANYKAACRAQGGIPRLLEDGPVCLPPGAVIVVDDRAGK